MSLSTQSLTEFSVLPYTDVLAWIVMAVFVAGIALDRRDRRDLAIPVTAGAWGLFAVFWFLLIHQFALIHRSAIQAVLVVIAVPACLYVGWQLYGGRESLLTLSRAIAFMTIIYLPFETSYVARQVLIETVATQTAGVIDVLGIGEGVRFVEDPTGETTFMNTFWFPETGQASRIVFACTGIGSIAIFGGLIAAVDAPRRKKAIAATVSIAVIWVLNIGRNAFIAVANGYQWFAIPWLKGPVMFLFGLSDPSRVSFFVADRILSQGLAVFALVGIAFLVSRWVPELLDVGEELLSVLLGREVRLRTPETAPDGGETEP